MRNRLFIGRVGSLDRDDLYKMCQEFGKITDFMLKGHFAFVVGRFLSFLMCRSMIRIDTIVAYDRLKDKDIGGDRL